MAEKKKYYIRVPEALIEVSKDVYLAYHQEERRVRTIEEKDQRNGKVSYDDLDTTDLTGQEMIPDRDAVSVEDAAIAAVLQDKLRHCLDLLDEPDKKLIYALYYGGMSERQFALKTGTHHMTVHNRKAAILRLLKKLMEI